MKRYLVALIVAGVADAISFMVVSPSLIFYVLKQGGTKDQYGLIMSSFSFASFCAKPFLGHLSDKVGFRTPYGVSLGIASLGSIMYAMAAAFPQTAYAVFGMNWSILGILASRLLMGVGAANSALGFAYVARVVPSDEQTSVNSLLSMGRIGGMTFGPFLNALLQKVNIKLFGLHLDPLNSVGIMVLLCNLLAVAIVLALLEEPPSKKLDKTHCSSLGDDDQGEEDEYPMQTFTLADKLHACLHASVWVPMFSIFSFNANFQLVETGFAPAVSDGLGWGPVQISVVLGGMSVMVAAGFATVSYLSGKRHVPDERILIGGLLLTIVSYSAIFFAWARNVPQWRYVIPVGFCALSFPFMAVPTRTIFTKAVDAQPALRQAQGSMQAVLSMWASVAGFTVPALVAAYCVRHPNDVGPSNQNRELTQSALMAPFMSMAVLSGVLYIVHKQKPSTLSHKGTVELEDEAEAEAKAINETTTLLSA